MSRGKPVHALLGLALTALAAEAVSAEVTVHFIEPSRYTDVGQWMPSVSGLSRCWNATCAPRRMCRPPR
jgi:hypothetical protein